MIDKAMEDIIFRLLWAGDTGNTLNALIIKVLVETNLIGQLNAKFRLVELPAPERVPELFPAQEALAKTAVA